MATVSKADYNSTATQTVRSGGFLWLNPIAMHVLNGSRAEVVECSGFDIYYDSYKAVKEAISKRKSELMEQRVIDCEGDQKNCFLSYIIYLVVKRKQCCQNIPALLLWHLQ